MTEDSMAKQRIADSILWMRGQRVMLDEDLAALLRGGHQGAEPSRPTELRSVSGGLFQLMREEYGNLKSQFATSSEWGGRRTPLYAFIEQGVAMLSSVLRSPRAIQVNIEIIRAFVRMREIVGTHRALARKLDALEKKYDGQFRVVFDAIRQLMATDAKPKRRIGFAAGAR